MDKFYRNGRLDNYDEKFIKIVRNIFENIQGDLNITNDDLLWLEENVFNKYKTEIFSLLLEKFTGDYKNTDKKINKRIEEIHLKVCIDICSYVCQCNSN